MSKTVISSDKAPAAIGTYSQAIKAGNTVYMSGQIPLDPKTMELVEGFEAQTVQVFENLKAVAEAAGGSFKDIVKLNIFLTDLSHFAKVNEIMGKYFQQPYPRKRRPHRCAMRFRRAAPPSALPPCHAARRSRWTRSWSSNKRPPRRPRTTPHCLAQPSRCASFVCKGFHHAQSACLFGVCPPARRLRQRPCQI